MNRIIEDTKRRAQEARIELKGGSVNQSRTQDLKERIKYFRQLEVILESIHSRTREQEASMSL